LIVFFGEVFADEARGFLRCEWTRFGGFDDDGELEDFLVLIARAIVSATRLGKMRIWKAHFIAGATGFTE
jgi:hypothetical protein